MNRFLKIIGYGLFLAQYVIWLLVFLLLIGVVEFSLEDRRDTEVLYLIMEIL